MSDKNEWQVCVVLRGIESNKIYTCHVPISMYQLLSLGDIYLNGGLLSTRYSGKMMKVRIDNLAKYKDLSSVVIDEELYSFYGFSGGTQRLFRYLVGDLEIFIPAMELIRYLFIHNRLLANTIMRPGAINLLFHPDVPGKSAVRDIRFTADVPKSVLNTRFVEEFAWIAFDESARRSWDSVYRMSYGQKYVTFQPPELLESDVTFFGVQHGNKCLVLKMLHLTGKKHPSHIVNYSHPLLSKNNAFGNHKSIKYDDEHHAEPDQNKNINHNVVYEYDSEQSESSVQSDRCLKTLSSEEKYPGFDNKAVIKKVFRNVNHVTEEASELETKLRKIDDVKTANENEKAKIVKVAIGERSSNGKYPPIDFRLLTSVDWDHVSDLESLSETISKLGELVPSISIAMSLCKLTSGRVFSKANALPRVALVSILFSEHQLPIVVLDVERTGDVALSVISIHFHEKLEFTKIELAVKKLLDGLVYASGHWDRGVEKGLTDICHIKRHPKLQARRVFKNESDKACQVRSLAMKLLNRLNLSI